MRIGIPKETKANECRVALSPEGVRQLVERGHAVQIQRDAGLGAGFADALYEAAGASLIDSAEALFDAAELVLKVKEPQPDECAMLRPGQILFTYLHLAPDPQQARGLIDSGVSAIAYETVTDANGRLPLLAPMSEVAGCMATQAGAHHLEKAGGGKGVLLSAVSGVEPGEVVVLGGGVVGSCAARIAIGMGASVTIIDRSESRLKQLAGEFGNRVVTRLPSPESIAESLSSADLVVGAALIPGAAAPKLVSREMLAGMEPGSVLVDVAIDQGGCFATSHPTTHAEPTFVVDDIVHYCVANIPGAVPRTATRALSGATLPYILRLAERGLAALKDDAGLRSGLNVHAGQIAHPAVADALGLDYVDPLSLLD